MSDIATRPVHPALVAGLFFSLALLAGCQSNSAPPPQAASSADLAGLPPIDGNPISADPRQEVLRQLTEVGDRVFFESDHHDISTAAEGTLRTQAALLQAYPAVTVTIEGHADERGTREYNLALADRRAEAVRTYLVALGVAVERIETVSYGKEKPACADTGENCWAVNRRGVTVVNQ
jgi:peptidoglycan-associated lipoprotein